MGLEQAVGIWLPRRCLIGRSSSTRSTSHSPSSSNSSNTGKRNTHLHNSNHLPPSTTSSAAAIGSTIATGPDPAHPWSTHKIRLVGQTLPSSLALALVMVGCDPSLLLSREAARAEVQTTAPPAPASINTGTPPMAQAGSGEALTRASRIAREADMRRSWRESLSLRCFLGRGSGRWAGTGATLLRPASARGMIVPLQLDPMGTPNLDIGLPTRQTPPSLLRQSS